MANHLIIGLGGTGGSVIRSLRKRIYEEFGKNDPGSNVNIEYLYVDSSPKDLNDRSTWKTLGASVHLADTQKVSIHGVGSNVLDNLYQFPGIESFVSTDDRQLFNDLGSLISDGIGGQRRRLGRLLFANNVCGPADSSFITRLKERVQNLTSRNNDEVVTFHICAGLAGGTGSGSIVDAISQIRKEYMPQVGLGDKYKVYLYLYIPEMIVADPARDAGYYQANGYAALCELNALSVNAYKPTDVTGRNIDEYGSVKRLLDGCDAFETAYIYSNANEHNKLLDIGTELPDAVADFIFQKVVVANLGGKMARLENCENSGTSPELDESGNAARSRRFIAFGIKRIEYPENEVKEYVAFNFATQAALQMQYNKWVGGIGYEESSIDEVGSGYQAELSKKENLEKFLLTDEYLTLSKPIIEDAGTKKWKPIRVAWDNWTNFFAENVQNEEEKKNWPAALLRSCEKQFNESYRGQGVKEFYRSYTRDIKAYASYIRKNAERILFNDWKNGVRSILEVEKYCNVLIERCNDTIEKYKENVAKYENVVNTQITQEIKNCDYEWNNIGWLRDAITKKSEKVFASYKTAQCSKYTYLTLIEGYRYAADLLTEVRNQFEMMRNGVLQFKAMLTAVLDLVVANAESKCNVADATDSNAKIVKKYDPETVRQNTRRFVADEEAMRANASDIRNELVSLLGDETPSFVSLYDKLGDIATVQDIFFNQCMVHANDSMVRLAQQDPTQKMNNVNVLEKIKQEYNSPERLESFVRSLFDSAQCYLQFDQQEMSKGTNQSQLSRMIQISLPKYDDPSNFRQKFIDTFASVCAKQNFRIDDCVSTNYKDNQIVVVAAASGFPLRYVANVANLRQKYDAKLIGPQAALNRMVLHTESFRRPLPSLFEASQQEKAKDLRPYAMLAYALGLVSEQQNPETGEKFFAIEGKDEFGFKSIIPVGKNIVQTVTLLSQKTKEAAQLIKDIDRKLDEEYVHNLKKGELREKLVKVVENMVLPVFGGNMQNKDFMAYRKDAIELMQSRLADK